MTIPQSDFIQRLLDQGLGEKYSERFYAHMWKLLVDSRAKLMKQTKKNIQKKVESQIKEQEAKHKKLDIEDVNMQKTECEIKIRHSH